MTYKQVSEWPDVYTFKLVPDELLDQCLDLIDEGHDVATIVQGTGIDYRSLLHALSCRYFDEGNPELARNLIEHEARKSRDFRLVIQWIRTIFACPEDDEHLLLEATRLLADSFSTSDATPHLKIRRKPRSHGNIRIGFLCSWSFSRLFRFSIVPLVNRVDRTRFSVGLFCLKNERSPEVSGSIKRKFDFVERIEAGDEKLAYDKIASHDLDILFDLNGHLCVDNPTIALLQKPAKVMVNWMNSPVSSGLAAYDYYLTDPFTVPKENQYLYSEKVKYLDCNCAATFELPNRSVPHSPVSEGYNFVFNSFNEVFKLNPLTLKVWSEILRRAPDSVLILKGNSLNADHSRKRKHIWRYMVDEGGVDPSRVIITPPRPFEEMLDDYGTADLSLGPIRYNGLTTTINSIWMGVPVIGYIGNKAEDRGAGAVMNQVGLQEFMAYSIEEYIEKAVAFALNPARLIELRLKLRERLTKYAYYNPDLFSESFMRACDDMLNSYHNIDTGGTA